MTTSIEQLLNVSQEKLLQASVEIIEKDAEIALLKLRIAALEGQRRRSAMPFKRDQTPALLRPQV